MVLRKLKHTEIPVWIKLRHLPVELWTTEGLSTVASGIGRPLYPDAITRTCTRLDFARVCVMLNVSLKLPKHVVIMMPNELEGESACKVDVEYEWLPPKCTGCSSLGHSTKECPLSKPTKPVVSIYVRKSMPITPAAPKLKMKEHVQAAPVPKNIHPETEVDRMARQGVLTNAAPQMISHVEYSDMECSGPEQEGPPSCSTRSCLRVLSRWRWFVDYAGPGNRIWIAWNDELIEVDILNIGTQFVLCRVLVHELHESIFITVVYGANDVSTSLDGQSLWKRLDRLLVNDVWMDRWPNLYYTCLTPRTSDHLPMVLKGDCRNMQVSLFRFDNYLALSPGFLAFVQSIWRHPVVVHQCIQ
ncbi:hypothetical protein Sango_2924300 [Sesamum angolense]|uniref:DUF4283 domain-containing protein n=1 Tax=Sesamum angolense TaxID=2727404 RepID=A0AAE1T5L7_9LAMI|nr:hypothetical protein Sango_2924300 [Sesamum angolense]